METEESIIIDESTPAPERIGFGKRLGAYLLDVVIATIGGIILGIFAGATLVGLFLINTAEEGIDEADAIGGGMMGMVGGMMGTMAGIIVMMLIIMLIEAITGQTFGKMILGYVDGSENGTKASLNSLITRALIKYIGFVMLLLAGLTTLGSLVTIGRILGLIVFIGFFFILGEKKQGFHDFIAKTAVYNKSDLP